MRNELKIFVTLAALGAVMILIPLAAAAAFGLFDAPIRTSHPSQEIPDLTPFVWVVWFVCFGPCLLLPGVFMFAGGVVGLTVVLPLEYLVRRGQPASPDPTPGK